MSLTKGLRLAAAGVAFSIALASAPAHAQEVSAEHLTAARAALTAIRATAQFDDILPGAALSLRDELLRKDPNLEDVINETINEQAIALASRRADLEREAALAYARNFSQEELQAIAEFYASPAGQKLLQSGPAVSAEVVRAANIWQNGIARDLAQQVATQLQAKVGDRAPAPEAAQQQ